MAVWHDIVGLIILAMGFGGTYLGGRYVNEHTGPAESFFAFWLLVIWLGGSLTFAGKFLGLGT
jgi:hypothetical protein